MCPCGHCMWERVRETPTAKRKGSAPLRGQKKKKKKSLCTLTHLQSSLEAVRNTQTRVCSPLVGGRACDQPMDQGGWEQGPCPRHPPPLAQRGRAKRSSHRTAIGKAAQSTEVHYKASQGPQGKGPCCAGGPGWPLPPSCSRGGRVAGPGRGLFPPGSELQGGDDTRTPSPLSLFTDTTPFGGVEMRSSTS